MNILAIVIQCSGELSPEGHYVVALGLVLLFTIFIITIIR